MPRNLIRGCSSSLALSVFFVLLSIALTEVVYLFAHRFDFEHFAWTNLRSSTSRVGLADYQCPF